MVSVVEGAQAPQGINAALDVGLDTLSISAVVTFTKYTRNVLPIDGYVFWLATTETLTIKGSLHYSVTRQQNEDETIGVNSVIFSAESKITDFNYIKPNELWLATLPDGVQYSFSQQGRYYAPANVYHYSGIAVYPAMIPQIIQDPSTLPVTTQVVSDSLPFWLALNTYVPPYPGFKLPSGFTLYPSFAVPNNLAPPYGSVHIEPASIDALQSAPFYDSALSHWQSAEETVRITVYGETNTNAITIMDTILQYSYDTNNFGLMNMPTIRDEKRTQAEMSVLAMKKTLTFQVSYSQYTSRSVARQLIETCVNTYLPQPYTAAGFGPIAP